jgi:hypothetical protein
MSNAIAINEGSEEFKAIKLEWEKKSREVTIDTLPSFLKELSEKYSHDYGTICHAVATAAIAAARAMDKSDQGGITGFQAGAIMWEFVRSWNYSGNKTGLKMVDYDNFLFPQYSDEFEKTLSPSVWGNLQKEAAKNIEEADAKYTKYLDEAEKYKKDIAAFVEKNPDYYDNREHYDPLGIGNSDQWAAEHKKKDSGFEFAPQEPYCPVNSDSSVYRHWASIVNGVVPFNYVVAE